MYDFVNRAGLEIVAQSAITQELSCHALVLFTTSVVPFQEKIIVSDQTPVARHEEIKVRLDMAELKPTRQTELGILEWKLDLDPGEERTIRFDFNVEHPRSLTVVGLPRE
jgi:hypothetical protein